MFIAKLGSEFGEFLHQNKLGTGTVGSGYQLERNPDTAREAQIAYTSLEKLPLNQRITGYAEVPPDHVVEVQGFNRGIAEVHEKARMWLSFGVRLVWVVHPDFRTVVVHRPEHPVETIDKEGELDGHDVLPGFGLPVVSIFGA